MQPFKAFRIHLENKQIVARFEQLALDDLNAGEVVVRVQYSGINYKDALAATGAGRILRRGGRLGEAGGVVLAAKRRKRRKKEKKRSSTVGLLFLFCVVCASWRLLFFKPLEVGRAAAGAEGAEAAEDDAEEE